MPTRQFVGQQTVGEGDARFVERNREHMFSGNKSTAMFLSQLQHQC